MPTKRHSTNAANDLYAEVTDRIVAALEAGVAPWVRPWSTAGDGGQFRNGATGHVYRGVNVILLAMAGYACPRWYTYRQAQALGGQVRRGEKGVRVIYWAFVDAKGANTQHGDANEATDSTKKIPFLRHFTVFNNEQIDWPERSAHTVVEADHAPSDLDDNYTRVRQVADATGAKIEHQGVRAYYSPTEDRIVIPARSRFDDPPAYHATVLHELGHWTGHGSRLARDLTGRFGSESYAAEELVAELASAFMCNSLRIDGRLQHENYIGSWIQVLRNDKRAIFTAARHAQQAADFVLGQAEPVQAEVESIKEAA